MLQLSFKRPGKSSRLDPAVAIEFRGGELFVGGTANIARYAAGQWVYASERWDYLECTTRVLLRFQDLSGRAGPLVGPRQSIRVRDRFAFAGRERVATLNPLTGLWQVHGTKEMWPLLRVTSHV